MCRAISLLALVLLAGTSGVGNGAEIAVPAEYPTIQAAVDTANPGDRVVVSPGRYQEALIMRDRVFVSSASSGEEENERGEFGLKRAEAVIIDGGGKSPAVVMAQDSILEGVTVTGAGEFDQTTFDKHFETRGENLRDEEGATGVEGGSNAIRIDECDATISYCIVRDNGYGGIGVNGEGNQSKIINCVVYRNLGGGIGFANGAEGEAINNVCFQNLRAGIGCRSSEPRISNNRCYGNVRAGIGVREGAKPVIIGNECFENRRAGVGIRMKGTSPRVQQNKCYRNGMSGIGIRNEASPMIVENECFENRLAGIGAMSDAAPTIIGNRIHGNLAAAIGLSSCQSGEAVIQENSVTATTLVALGINKGWKVTLVRNEIQREGGMPPLVMVAKGAKVEFIENTFTGSGVAAIRSQGDIIVKGNVFICPSPRKAGPPQSAVWALKGSNIEYGDDNQNQGWRNALQGP